MTSAGGSLLRHGPSPGGVRSRLTQRHTHSPLRRRRLAVVVIAAIAFGILGMHALTTKDIDGPPGHTTALSATHALLPALDTTHHSASSTTIPGPSQVTMAAQHAEETHAPTTGQTDRDAGHGAHGDGGAEHVMMLCAAMLAAAALLALGALACRLPRLWAVLAPAVIRQITRRVAPTGTGPPAVWRFSIIRC